jgi:hypothetical protein
MTCRDFSHLHALEHGLHNERARLASAKTESERALRSVWIRQREREIAQERVFLGIPADHGDTDTMTDDELLEALAI